jgi:hypothetical protein
MAHPERADSHQAFFGVYSTWKGWENHELDLWSLNPLPLPRIRPCPCGLRRVSLGWLSINVLATFLVVGTESIMPGPWGGVVETEL